mmetsp:Transcript_305/g.749  ORF Transcript_305/g.749 Transcript_305/m.749 type:complete len:437 (+) Transcript_305:168-1478(+)
MMPATVVENRLSRGRRKKLCCGSQPRTGRCCGCSNTLLVLLIVGVATSLCLSSSFSSPSLSSSIFGKVEAWTIATHRRQQQSCHSSQLHTKSVGSRSRTRSRRRRTALFSLDPKSRVTSTIDSDAADDIVQTMDSLMEWFSGDFDNYQQVVEDRRLGLLPKEGGGHEHFHCTLIPVNTTTRLAAFYFDGNPQRIFRFRFYEIVEVVEPTSGELSSFSSSPSSSIEMRLYTLHPELETKLRSHADEPSTWPTIFYEFDPISSSSTVELPKVSILPKCEIAWSTQKDPAQHSYIDDVQEDSLRSTSSKLSPVHAVMVYGEAIVNSTIIPGMMIRIVDQLSLFENSFYINDRGFDPASGDYIYGNQRDVPYVLQRVSRFVPQSIDDGTGPAEAKQYHREIVDADLEWTLGPRWRSEEEYDQKIESIGGPSIGIKRSVKK